jgi:hypothetical protein
MYSLTVRIALSISLFLLLIIGFMTGLLQPHGMMPDQNVPAQNARPSSN